MLKNIIFDWSGTLIDDMPAVIAGTNGVLRNMGKPELTREQFRTEFCLPVMKFYNRVVPGVDPMQVKEWFQEAVLPMENKIEPIPFAEDFLKYVRTTAIRTFLFSSIQKKHYERLIANNHFDRYFDHAYVEVWDKKQQILELMQKYNLLPDETLFIGDMVHDMETAQHGKMHSCAVLTGYTHLAPLQECKPELILDNLLPLHQAMKAVGFDWKQIVAEVKKVGAAR